MKFLTTPRLERSIGCHSCSLACARLVPAAVSIPKRFTEVTTWKGKVDGELLAMLKNSYGRSILKLARDEGQ